MFMKSSRTPLVFGVWLVAVMAIVGVSTGCWRARVDDGVPGGVVCGADGDRNPAWIQRRTVR